VSGKSTWLGIPCAKKDFTAGVNETIFVKETKIPVHLNHPTTVKFLCCGNDPWKGYYFIAMELMDMSLSEFIKLGAKNRGPLFSHIVAPDTIVQNSTGDMLSACLWDCTSRPQTWSSTRSSNI
jgi:hypothetical protein